MTFLETTSDLEWLRQVHGIDYMAHGYIVAVITGNADCPEFVQCYYTNHYLAVPDVYTWQNGVLTLTVDKLENGGV